MGIALYSILWFIVMVIAIGLLFGTIGNHLLHKLHAKAAWWMLPAQYVSLAFYALVILSNPWNGFFYNF